MQFKHFMQCEYVATSIIFHIFSSSTDVESVELYLQSYMISLRVIKTYFYLACTIWVLL